MFRKRHPPAGAKPGTLMIARGSPPPRIHVIAYAPDKIAEHDVDEVSKLREHLRADRVTWIDVQGTGDESVVTALGELFGIHPLALEDMVNVPQRPKIEVFDDHTLVIVQMALVADEAGAEQEQVSMFVGDNFVLTIQERYGDVFDPVRTRIRQGGPIFRSSGSEYLGYALIDAVIDGYFPILENFGDQLEDLEGQIVASANPDAFRQIHHIKRELLRIRRMIWPLREVINNMVRDDNHFISEKVQVHLRDCYDHCVQLIDVVETCRELASGLVDAYMSSVANRQNEVMKTLTIMASIFIPLSFLAGVYGMNFDYMPELHSRWSYPILLAVMASSAAGMVVYFHRKGWIRWGSRGDDE